MTSRAGLPLRPVDESLGADPPAPVARPEDLAGRPDRRLALSCLVAALALVGHATAYALGWAGWTGPALALWYVALVALVVPFALLLTSAGTSPRDRLLGSVAYGVALHVSWLLSSPVLATRFDETLHVTTLLQLLEGRFLGEHSMLPVSPHYPGLELVAVALVWLTGVPPVVAQVATVLLARVVLVLALFALGTRLGRSTRVGALVVLLYSGSTHFYFFNAQFSYQTVAVAMLVASVVLLLQAADTTGRRTWLLLGAAQATLAALTVTHHLTSWLTLAALWVVAGLLALGQERRRARLVLWTAEAATAVAALWTTVVAPLLVRYLGPLADNAGSELARLVTLDSTGSRAVLEAGGNATPLWQVGVMAASILLWCALLAPALLTALRGTTVARSRARWVLVGLAASYPVLHLVRFFPTAAEMADRASSFVTMAAALLVALWLVPRLARGRHLVVPGAVLLVLGGVLLGGGQDWQRVPGPYLPGAEQRSVDATTLSFARWAGRHLPEGARVASDVTINRVLPNLAPVEPVTSQSGSDNLTPVFLAETVDDEVVTALQDNQVDFVVVDTRTIGRTALSSSYYEAGSAFGEGAVTPTRQMLLKFDGVPGFERVLDGDIVVWDVRPLRGEATDFADRPDPGLPGTWQPWQVVVSALAGLLLLLRRRHLVAPVRDAAGTRMWVWALVLPALMLTGALGVALDVLPRSGSTLLVCLVLAALVVVPDHRGPRQRSGAATVALRAATTALVALAVVVALRSAWDAQVADDLPPPPAVQTEPLQPAGSGGGSTAGTPTGARP